MAWEWAEHKKEAINVVIGFLVVAAISVLTYAVKAYADENYVGTKNLQEAVASRDLKDINKELDSLELEIQRASIWLRFLPQDEVNMRQIYNAEIDLLRNEKTKVERERQEALQALGTITSAESG